MEELLNSVKAYLRIDYNDDDEVLKGFIERGKSYLDSIAGKKLDYTTQGLHVQLLFDYCRYANSHALEVFSQNFQSEIMQLYCENLGGTTDANVETNSGV